MSSGIGGEQFGDESPQDSNCLSVGCHVKVPNWAVPTHHVNIAKISCTSGQEGPDPVDEQEDMEVKVGHLAAACLDPVIPVPV